MQTNNLEALEVEAEDPEQFAASQPPVWSINWRGVGICLAVEACLCSGVWWLLQPVAIPPGLIITGFLGGWLFSITLLASYRIRNPRRRLMFFLPLSTLGPIVTLIGRATFSTPVTPHSTLINLSLMGVFCGFAVVISAANRQHSSKT